MDNANRLQRVVDRFEMFPQASRDATPGATRRLQRDYQKLLTEPLPGIHACPTEENILEWHYVIEGSPDTPYYGGYYHGKIVFQPDFPWKPPAICMITPNGRFRINMRLCLSISDYHPESWNPGWTVSSILVGLHSFMNEEGIAAGVIQDPIEIRRKFATDSITFNLSNPEFCRMFPELAKVLVTISSPPPPAADVFSSSTVPNIRKRESSQPNDSEPAKKVPELVDLTDD